MWGRKLCCSRIDRPGLVRLRHYEEGLRALTLAACKAMFGDSTVRCAEAKTTTFSPPTYQRHTNVRRTPRRHVLHGCVRVLWCVGAPREAAPRRAAPRGATPHGVRSYLFYTDVRSILMGFITAFQRCVLQQCERRAPPARSASKPPRLPSRATGQPPCKWFRVQQQEPVVIRS